MKKPKFKILRTKAKQSGMASFIVVTILVVLITLISIGFTRLINRSVNRSANNVVASAADYAAQAGINEVLTLMKKAQANSQDIGTLFSNPTNCQGLIQPSTGTNQYKVKQFNTGQPAQYTCILVSPGSTQTIVNKQAANLKAWVFKLASTASSLSFTWGCSSPTIPANNCNSLPPANTTNLLDETTWNTSGYPPVLRVQLYPVPPGDSLTYTQDHSKTFYLYPNPTASGLGSFDWSTTDGSLKAVKCTISPDSCSVTIDNVSTALSDKSLSVAYFWAHITPIYNYANISISGNDSSGGSTTFIGSQAVIDVTAKTSSSVKRLQAHVDLGSTTIDDTVPDTALRSAVSLCKQEYVYLDKTHATNNFNQACNYGNLRQPNGSPDPGPPTRIPTLHVSFAGPGSASVQVTSPIAPTSFSCSYSSGSVSPNPCKQEYDGLPTITVKFSASGTYGAPTINWGRAAGSCSGTSCSNILMDRDENITVTFPTTPPPQVELCVNSSGGCPTSASVSVGQSFVLGWSTAGTSSCSGSGAWSGSITPLPNGTRTTSQGSAGTYTYVITCSNSSGSASAQVTVNVGSAPPPPSSNLRLTVDNHYSMRENTIGQTCGQNSASGSGNSTCSYSVSWGSGQSITGNNASWDQQHPFSRFVFDGCDPAQWGCSTPCPNPSSSGFGSYTCNFTMGSSVDTNGDGIVDVNGFWVFCTSACY